MSLSGGREGLWVASLNVQPPASLLGDEMVMSTLSISSHALSLSFSLPASLLRPARPSAAGPVVSAGSSTESPPHTGSVQPRREGLDTMGKAFRGYGAMLGGECQGTARGRANLYPARCMR
jgi:hypothetical protein